MDQPTRNRQRRLALGLGLAWVLPTSAKPGETHKSPHTARSTTGRTYGHQPAVQAFAAQAAAHEGLDAGLSLIHISEPTRPY